ncbi:molybdopterin-dependent oxidoreductase [Denitratisoma oestradiolicum]|uniref:Molybdopterin oxidoreductase n=1 Tax=Denitratisoma oestradiolicum TaxID=311182 RepID=A0A6S6XWP5_9PROT|nr:molybdopterin-dependent oxidoreductase [Denitratisoma oestradiolicum]CAB1368517.1 Molybdopterin oxidoreductase [Denitratisoma oestradiolicum]
MSESMKVLPMSRRRFLQASGIAGAAGAAGIGAGVMPGFKTIGKAHAAPAPEAGGGTVITKSFCHQCPARCGIDVYTTNGRVHAIYGTLDNPISNGKLCPKGHYGTYLLYDPDRFKGPMKRTNPKKGRNEDPRFVPISWDEALKTAADRLNALRDKGESHRFGLLFGRGWGATDAGLLGDFAKLYGSPNVGINHSSMCSDASKKAKLCADGNYSYNSYDYENTNYLLIFGASFLESFRPLNNNLQAWGTMRSKAPRTMVTVVDVHTSTTGAAADRLLLTKSGTDGALALAMAHVILTEGLWDRKFVGDFIDGINRFKSGEIVAMAYSQEDLAKRRELEAAAAVKKTESDKKALADKAKLQADIDSLRVKIEESDDEKIIPGLKKALADLEKKAEGADKLAAAIKEQRGALGQNAKPQPDPAVGETIFREKWTLGLLEWWNAVLKDCTPEWAEKITTIPAREIKAVAKEFGSTRPAIALFERGATAHTNGIYNGMAIHALNALVGSLFAKGGLGYQSSVPWGKVSVKADKFMDSYAMSSDRKKPRIDKVKTDAWPMASNMMQEIAKNHLKGDPYKMDTLMFYLTGPIFSGPECKDWEKSMAETYVIDTSPYPGETAVFADLILPDHSYLERLQIADTYPFQGYPIAMIRTPAIKPLYDTKVFGDVLIEIGKRIQGPMGEYYKQLGNTESMIKQMAKGFEEKPGSNGVNSYESFVQKGVWFKKPYGYRQVAGEFYFWDGDTKSYSKQMVPAEVKDKLLKTPSGKYEFKSGYLADEHHAHYVHEKLGIDLELVGFPQYIPARHPGGGDLHFVSPKLAAQAEGRQANLPHASAFMQPTQGGKREVFLEIHPETAAKRGIRNGDRVRVKNDIGAIEVVARLYTGIRPDTVALPMIHGHWAQGRWATAKERNVSGSTNEITANVSEPISGLACYHTGKVFVEKV